MKIKLSQLAHTTETLAPFYMISGEETLLIQDAISLIRQRALTAGFNERISITLEPNMHFEQLFHTHVYSLSLFSNKKIIEFNLNTVKFNQSHGKILIDYLANPDKNILLLIQTTKIEPAQEKAIWFQTLEKKSIFLTVWPIPALQLPQWIMEYAKKYQLNMTKQLAEQLAFLVEGNLLAAKQEIEKLSLQPSETLDAATLQAVVTDHANFDIFNLVDSALLGLSSRCIRILHYLHSSHVEPTLILWALMREVRLLATLQKQMLIGSPLPQLFIEHRIWEKRQASIRSCLQRHTEQGFWELLTSGAKIDRMIKGVEKGNSWNELEQLTLKIAKMI